MNQKIRNFGLDTLFNSSVYSNEYTLYNFPPMYDTDIKLKNFQKSQEIIGLFSDKNNKTKDKNEKNNGK